jgi:hypothetical protein
MGPEVNSDPQGEGGVEIPTGDHPQEGGLGDQGSRVLKVHLVAKVSMVSRGGSEGDPWHGSRCSTRTLKMSRGSGYPRLKNNIGQG